MYKKESRQMIGWLVQQVDYTEVDYYPAHPQPCYATDHPQIHTVDFSIRLRFTNQQSVEISWKNFEGQDTENNTYGLNISTGTTAQQSLAGQRTWDVSGENPWLDLIGQAVKDIKVYWTKAWSETPEEAKSVGLLRCGRHAGACARANRCRTWKALQRQADGDLRHSRRGCRGLKRLRRPGSHQ